jgi:hypothetical protein
MVVVVVDEEESLADKGRGVFQQSRSYVPLCKIGNW